MHTSYTDALMAPVGDTTGAMLFFPGCSLKNRSDSLTHKTFDLLREQGMADEITYLCCGKILEMVEGMETLDSYRARMTQALLDRGITRIIAACPNCFDTLTKMKVADERLDALELIALPEALASAGVRLNHSMLAAHGIQAVTVHDSCPDRERGVFASGVRALLDDVQLYEMPHARANSRCCGSKIRQAGHEDGALKCAIKRCEEADATGADCLVTACMSCTHMLNLGVGTKPVYHYLELLFDEYVEWKGAPGYMDITFLPTAEPSYE